MLSLPIFSPLPCPPAPLYPIPAFIFPPIPYPHSTILVPSFPFMLLHPIFPPLKAPLPDDSLLIFWLLWLLQMRHTHTHIWRFKANTHKWEKPCDVLSGSGFPHSAVNGNASIKFSGQWMELKISFPRFIFQLFFSLTMGTVAKFLIGSLFLLAFHWRPHYLCALSISCLSAALLWYLSWAKTQCGDNLAQSWDVWIFFIT